MYDNTKKTEDESGNSTFIFEGVALSKICESNKAFMDILEM